MQTNLTKPDPLLVLMRNTQRFLSLYGSIVILVCLSVILFHYFFSVFQPVRWPTKIYFFVSLALALASRKWSLFFVLFSLPLLPELHIQAQFVFRPAVPYFVSYPGMDVIAGFCIGQFVRVWLFEKQELKNIFHQPPWPIGLLLLVLSASAFTALARNLWQSALSFDATELFSQAVRFKLLNRLNDYYPLVDLMVYSFCGVFIVALLTALREKTDQTELLFKPILFGLIASALWGIFQALTGFALPSDTTNYRPENFGFGAQGFQPDIHSYAGHMLLGAAGLWGILVTTASLHIRRLAGFTTALCWVALIFSKSRASLLLAGLTAFIFVIWLLFKKSIDLRHRLIGATLLIGSIVCFALLTNNLGWMTKFYAALTHADWSNFEVLNQISRDRLDLHTAALRMGLSYPIFGIGQGDFFRLSSIVEFSGSAYMAKEGGENAHNYFFQTFAEVGFVGVACFMLVFIAPLLKGKNSQILLPIYVATFSIFLGNVYSHSLIIRENLFLLSALVALLYAQTINSWGQITDHHPVDSKSLSGARRLVWQLAIILVIATIGWGIVEIQSSFYKMPFLHGTKH